MTLRNAFLAMAELASKENWCWKIPCTTCGSMYFKSAFRELISGKHPDQKEWLTMQKNHHKLDLFERLSLDEQEKLSDVVIGASVVDLLKVAKFPDWLGYLGLVLHNCGQLERTSSKITKVFVPQFLDLVKGLDDFSAEKKGLKEKNTISFYDLEIVEKMFKEDYTIIKNYNFSNYL